MELKIGSRWRSAVCAAEVVVVRPPKGEAVLSCGGQPMVGPGETPPANPPAPAAGASDGALIGKRYVDEESGLEALCNKAGVGSLAVNGRPMTIRETKKLPSSD